jgi:hypothetical protein
MICNCVWILIRRHRHSTDIETGTSARNNGRVADPCASLAHFFLTHAESG